MDPTTLIPKLLEQPLLIVILVFAVVTLWKKVNEVQEARIKDSNERSDAVVIALEAVTEKIGSFDDEMKSIRISLDKQNGKNEK